MRARTSTIGLKDGWTVTSFTFSPLIQTCRPSRSDSRYCSPVLIMTCLAQDLQFLDVIPAKAGIQSSDAALLDPRFRGGDSWRLAMRADPICRRLPFTRAS